MDDLMVKTTSVPGSRWILGVEKLIIWVQISFKPVKYRSLGL